METSNNIRDIALERCEDLLKQYFSLKMKSYRRSSLTQLASLVLTAITPVLLLIPMNGEYLKFFAAATSVGAAISTGLLSIYGWRETYVRSGYTYHALESEMNRYLTQASDDYANLDKEKAAQNFSKRIEEIYMAEVTDWRSEMQRIEQQRPRNGNNATNDE
jgi:Protein of unknown function (DUF4231)